MNIFDVLIVQPVFNMLLGLYSIIPFGGFGVSLIIFTIMVRMALWPLVKKQLHQTKAMQRMQPELALIKKRTKGNKQLESMQMLELYKKHGINPFRSIGILLIQLPIFIALYSVINIITTQTERVEDFAYGFMENLGPVKAIIDNPDTFNDTLFGLVDLTGKAVGGPGGVNIALLLLAVGASVLQYIMTKQTMPKQQSNKRLRDIMAEAASGKEADQGEMNAAVMGKMMKFLPFMMFFIMISLPGALVLYYGVSNLVAVLQQHHILKEDEVEMDKLADKEISKESGKKATAKARAKQATEAKVVKTGDELDSNKTKITRIKAKDSSPTKINKRRS